METNNLKKKYFLHLTKDPSVILYIEDYHVAEITNPPQSGLGIGLSSDYQSIRFYRIDMTKDIVDHKRFILLPSDYHLKENHLVNFELPF